ncbi:DUF86 domain-containing protein [Peribacillus saganii]|uniref:DUF86 domain-containing protein n=1 Tax=Peribacillus saganii TaxID=2303992 RepID=A0A372LRQ1_9BACI|nr:DUF86 domain-containing protein [Peribacillus saganii]RFU70105.1 DUF86 domain-containing protein [Peribacillus saganii]
MYFVDRDQLELTLQYMERQIRTFQKQSQWESEMELLSLERIVQTSIEAVLDVGNAMIDGFIMRDPGSYEDIIDILLDEKVITEEVEQQLKRVLPLRKALVQDYISIDHSSVFQTFKDNTRAFELFPEAVRTYLVNELGPVSAFKN